MRLAALVLLGACCACGACGAVPGAAPGVTPTLTASGEVAATASVSAGGGGGTTTSLRVDGLGAAPQDVDDHLHAPPTYVADFDRLYVEITSEGEHADVLRNSAINAVSEMPNIASVEDGGDIELHVEIASLTPDANGAACQLKIFVMRLPQHDLLAIADGRGRATGRGASDACLATISSAIVRQKLPPFFERQLDAKR